MTVYLDMIFLLNCLTDAAALYVTGRLSGLPLERKRVLAASLLGGTYGALCALPGWGAAASLLPQAAAAAGLVRLAFGRREFGRELGRQQAVDEYAAYHACCHAAGEPGTHNTADRCGKHPLL